MLTQFRVVVDRLFPGYDKLFHKVHNPTSLQLLSRYSTPQEILHADREALLHLLIGNRRGRAWNEAKLNVLIDIAKNSLPDPQAIQANKVALRNYIQLLHCYRTCIKDVEQQLLLQADAIPAYELLRTIPGVGPLTAAIIVSEIGDIKRFPSSKQLTAFAGLDSSVYESGTFKFKASQNRISKRGSVYLRTALYQATVCGISQQIHGPRNMILSKYYQQKRVEGKQARSAIVATSNKLLCIIYGMWSRQTPFLTD